MLVRNVEVCFVRGVTVYGEVIYLAMGAIDVDRRHAVRLFSRDAHNACSLRFASAHSPLAERTRLV